MAKIKITTTDSKLFVDTLSFGSTAPASTTVTLLAASSLSVAGVGKVVGSSGIDNITLLGAFSASAAKAKFGFSEIIPVAGTFEYDTKSLAQSTVDILTGTIVKDIIALKNTYATSPTFGVNLKYTAGSTQLDTLTGTVLNDQITLASTSNILYKSTNTSNTELAKADTITGSSGADKIELGGGDRFWAVKTGGGADTITGTSGLDNITLVATPTTAFTFSESATTNTGGDPVAAGTDTLIGSVGADVIKLDSSTLRISYQTGGGIDTLYGTTGVDAITLGAAGTLKYNSGSAFEKDTISLSSGSDTLTLLVAADVAITSNGGSDKIVGSSSQDTIALTTTVTDPVTTTTLQPLGGGDIIDLTDAEGAVVISFQSKTDSSTSETTRDSITAFDDAILSFSFKKGVAASTGVSAVIGVLKNNDISLLGAGEVTSKFTDGAITAFSGAATAVPSARFDEDLSVLEIDTDGNGTADMSIELIGITAVADLGSLAFSIES